jgi:hypothetical protein
MIQLSDYKKWSVWKLYFSGRVGLFSTIRFRRVNQGFFGSSPLAVAGTSLVVATTLLDRTHFVGG